MQNENPSVKKRIATLIESVLSNHDNFPDNTEIFKDIKNKDTLKFTISPAGKEERDKIVEILTRLGFVKESGAKLQSLILGSIACVVVESPQKRAIFTHYKRNPRWVKV